jgi:hypothetical protein
MNIKKKAILVLTVLVCLLFVIVSRVYANKHPSIFAGGSLRGTVLDENTGEPVVGIPVVSYKDGYPSGGADTDSQGQFWIWIDDIPGQVQYQLSFALTENALYNIDSYFPEWYENKSSLETADVVTVTSGQTTFITASLAPAGIIAGEINLGEPLLWPESVVLSVYSTNLPPDPVDSTQLASAGHYQLGQLHTGQYKLLLDFQYSVTDEPNVASHSLAYFDLKSTFEDGDIISVTEGVTTTVDIIVPQLGQICGSITDYFTGQTVPLFRVDALNVLGERMASTHTDLSGHYCIRRLVSGSYTVVFTGFVWGSTCYKGCNGSILYEEQKYPETITLLNGQTISQIDGVVVPYQLFIPSVNK